MIKGSYRLGFITVLAALIAGCSSTPPTRFYTMTPQAEAPLPSAPSKMLIGLGPVTVPAYLDRPSIVTRMGPNRLRVADFDQWGEPLDNMVPRVLGQDLRRHLDAREVVELPTRRDLVVDYGIEVDITRFDTDADGKVILDARWQIFKADAGEPLKIGHSSITEDGAVLPQTGDPSDEYDTIAGAMSRALERLSGEIAAAVIAENSSVAGKGKKTK
ncbi:MAG: ABC-type transport auxiliary lipoprotein family protein [Geminicoccaceae bacterium]